MRNLPPVLVLAWCSLAIAAAAETAGEVRGMTLSEALGRALDGNPHLAAATQDEVLESARVREAQAGFHPQLTAHAAYTRYQEPSTVLPIHQVGIFPPLDDDIYESRLQLQTVLFDGDRRSLRVKSAQAGAEAAQARLDGARQETLAAVSRLYIEARSLEEAHAVLQSRLAALHQRRHDILELLGLGRASDGDLALLDATIGNVQADSLDHASRLLEIGIRLAQWLGSDSPIRPLINQGLISTDSLSHVEPAREGEPPAVELSAALLAKAGAQHKSALRSSWPELTAFGNWQARAGETLDFSAEWAAGVSFKLPLYMGGGLRAGAQAAAAGQRAAERRHEAVRLEQRASEDLAMTRWRSARAQAQALSGAVEAKSRATAAARALQQAGRITLAELLAQEQEGLALQLAATRLWLAGRLALLDVHRVAGTLTQAQAHFIVEGGA